MSHRMHPNNRYPPRQPIHSVTPRGPHQTSSAHNPTHFQTQKPRNLSLDASTPEKITISMSDDVLLHRNPRIGFTSSSSMRATASLSTSDGTSSETTSLSPYNYSPVSQHWRDWRLQQMLQAPLPRCLSMVDIQNVESLDETPNSQVGSPTFDDPTGSLQTMPYPSEDSSWRSQWAQRTAGGTPLISTSTSNGSVGFATRNAAAEPVQFNKPPLSPASTPKIGGALLRKDAAIPGYRMIPPEVSDADFSHELSSLGIHRVVSNYVPPSTSVPLDGPKEAQRNGDHWTPPTRFSMALFERPASNAQADGYNRNGRNFPRSASEPGNYFPSAIFGDDVVSEYVPSPASSLHRGDLHSFEMVDGDVPLSPPPHRRRLLRKDSSASSTLESPRPDLHDPSSSWMNTREVFHAWPMSPQHRPSFNPRERMAQPLPKR